MHENISVKVKSPITNDSFTKSLYVEHHLHQDESTLKNHDLSQSIDPNLFYDEAPLLNISDEEFAGMIAENFKKGYLDRTTEIIFIIIYIILIIFGVVGNVMVGYVIWRKRVMRTPRNLYIINLTLSDLSMCIVSMPFTMIWLLNNDWYLGTVICKLIPVLQCTNILVSTLTIVAIAADRYVTIVRVGQPRGEKIHVAIWLTAIWLVSFLFTLPLYFYYYVDQVKYKNKYVLFRTCVEKWPSSVVRELWVIALMLLQYILPIVVLVIVHGGIKIYLGRHMMSQNDPRRAQREIERNRKTTILLSTIAVIFAVSWLPWHIVNLLADYKYTAFHNDPNHFTTVFGSCHLVAMSSACTNPVLYGWLNTNLRRELKDFLPRIFQKLSWILPYKCKRRAFSNNASNINNDDSPTRPAESVTLFVFQATTANSAQTAVQTPATTTFFIKDEI